MKPSTQLKKNSTLSLKKPSQLFKREKLNLLRLRRLPDSLMPNLTRINSSTSSKIIETDSNTSTRIKKQEMMRNRSDLASHPFFTSLTLLVFHKSLKRPLISSMLLHQVSSTQRLWPQPLNSHPTLRPSHQSCWSCSNSLPHHQVSRTSNCQDKADQMKLIQSSKLSSKKNSGTTLGTNSVQPMSSIQTPSHWLMDHFNKNLPLVCNSPLTTSELL